MSILVENLITDERLNCVNNQVIPSKEDLLIEIERLETLARFCAGMISGIPEFQDKHPEEVLKWINSEVAKLMAAK